MITLKQYAIITAKINILDNHIIDIRNGVNIDSQILSIEKFEVELKRLVEYYKDITVKPTNDEFIEGC